MGRHRNFENEKGGIKGFPTLTISWNTGVALNAEAV